MRLLRRVDTVFTRRHAAAMLQYLILVPAGLIFLLALVRYGVFLLSNARAGRLAEIRREAGGLGRGLALGAATAMAADILAMAGILAALLPERRARGAGVPILMVHGLYHNRTAWFLFRRRLRRAGFSDLSAYGYNSFTRDFDHAVSGMERKLDTVFRERPGAKVVLVGHSLGGLVCRCAAARPRFAGRIAALVTLGSPHKGSELALLGPNRMARDLLPAGYIPKAVADAPDPDCPRLGILTSTDDYVIPLDLLRTGRAGWEEQVCSPMGHVWMLYSPEVAARVVAFLRRAGLGPGK